MDDLLSRLRTQAEWHSDGHGPLHKEAADNIQHLRGAHDALRQEIARLRAALKEIAEFVDEGGTPPEVVVAGMARRALEQKAP